MFVGQFMAGASRGFLLICRVGCCRLFFRHHCHVSHAVPFIFTSIDAGFFSEYVRGASGRRLESSRTDQSGPTIKASKYAGFFVFRFPVSGFRFPVSGVLGLLFAPHRMPVTIASMTASEKENAKTDRQHRARNSQSECRV